MNKSQKSKVKSIKYKKILIVRLDKMGDVLLSTPVIKALRDAYPESHIAFMSQLYTHEIVEGNPYLDEVLIYDKLAKERGILGNIKFIWGLRKKRFDIAIILHPSNRTHIVTFLAGIPVRVGYDRKAGFLLTRKIPHAKQFGLKHETDYTLDILRYIGIEPKDRALYMPIRPECEKKIKGLFDDNGIKDKDMVVVVSPGTNCPSKRWAAARFAEVADELTEKYGAKIITISSLNDKVYGDRMSSLMKRGCINLSGRTTIGDIASLLKRARLFISNDSGPVAIASALGTPVIVIYSRSDRGLSPKRWGPTGKGAIVLHKDIGCDTCLAHNCKIGFKCLDAITVEDVLRSAEKVLG